MQEASYRNRPTDTPADTFRPHRKRLSVADWRALVRSNRNISGETRALLEMLSYEMRGQRMFSVSQRLMADTYGVSQRTIRGRIEEAHAAGLLVTVVHGKPGTTAVYQGTRPDPDTKRAPRKPPAYAGRAAQDTPETGPEHVLAPPHKQTGQHVREGVPPTSEHGEALADVRESPRGDVKPRSTTNASVRADEATTVIVAAPERSDAAERSEDVPEQPHTGRSSGNSVPDPWSSGTANACVRRGETPKGLLLDEIQRCAADDRLVSLDLADMLDAVEPDMGFWALDHWTFSAAAADRYEAGKQLNMLKNTYRARGGVW